MALLAASAALLCLVPPLSDALPQALLAGMSHTRRFTIGYVDHPGVAIAVLCCAYLEKSQAVAISRVAVVAP